VLDLPTLSKKRTETEDYYYENGRMVFTAHYLKKRGTCCGNGCRHCPFDPKHVKSNKTTTPDKKAKT